MIQYNLLNLPDQIQFTEGHKNIYTYDASGRKLEAVNYTVHNIINVPINTISTLPSNPSDYTKLTTDYVGNMIYENGSLKQILLPEGYYQGGVYYYYLKDHLGNNRVVINSSGAIMEKNHYYPSGMRFSPESTSNTAALPYRYNGKELEAMNGLNQYDYGARRRGAGLPIWTGVDPLAEKYYSISPYAYCGGNPVNRIDPDGRWIKGTDGKAVTYSVRSGWSSNATIDEKRIGNSIMYTNKGQSQLGKMFDATYPITLKMSDRTITGFDKHGNKTYQLGNTNNSYDNNCKVSSSVLTVYEGSINEYIKDNKNSKDPEAQSYQTNAKDINQRIGAVAGHESVHATDANNQQQKYDNDHNNASNDVESVPVQTEDLILDQTGFVNSGQAKMNPLPNPLSTPLNAPQPEPLK